MKLQSSELCKNDDSINVMISEVKAGTSILLSPVLLN